MRMSDDLVVVRTYLNKFEAEVAKTALDAADIDSLIRADECGGVRPGLWMSGVELVVRTEDAARAEEILRLSRELSIFDPVRLSRHLRRQ